MRQFLYIYIYIYIAFLSLCLKPCEKIIQKVTFERKKEELDLKITAFQNPRKPVMGIA